MQPTGTRCLQHISAPALSAGRKRRLGHAATPSAEHPSLTPRAQHPLRQQPSSRSSGQRLRAPVTSAASTAPCSTLLQQGRISHHWQQLVEPCSRFTPHCRPGQAAGCRSQGPAEPSSCGTTPRSSSLHLQAAQSQLCLHCAPRQGVMGYRSPHSTQGRLTPDCRLGREQTHGHCVRALHFCLFMFLLGRLQTGFGFWLAALDHQLLFLMGMTAGRTARLNYQ